MKPPPSAPRAAHAATVPFRPARLVEHVTSAIIIGLLQVLLATSLAALVFSGPLSPFIGRGVGFIVVGSIVAATSIGLLSTLPATFGSAQNSTGAIFAIIAANLAAAAGAAGVGDAAFATVVVAMTLTSVSTGAFLLALGRFRLGNLVRYLPYPVVGGFLAGTGWLLSTGAIGVMAGEIPALRDAWTLFQPEVLALWLPGLTLALVLLPTVARVDHFLVLPVVIAAALVVFYIAAQVFGASMSDLSAGGWLLGPFPEGSLWQPLSPGEVRMVRWDVIWSQIPAMATILPLAAIAVLLNAGGLELVHRKDTSLDRELGAAGVASLLSGVASGLVAFQQVSVSTLAHKLKVESRTAPLFAAAVAALALLAGASFLSLVPRFVLGGLLLYIGLGFLRTWLIEAWFRLPRLEYAVVATILVAVAAIGFLPGVAVGVVAAVVLFVVMYSRIDVVRHELTGAHATSRVTRSPQLREVLQARAARLHVLQLQGFIFFGTGDMLLRRVRRRLEGAPGSDMRYLVLDFRRVTGLDSTATLGFAKIRYVASSHGITVILTGVPPVVREQLVTSGLGPGDDLLYLPDLDQGLERCENELLREAGIEPRGRVDLEAQLESLLKDEPFWRGFLPYLATRTLRPGAHLIHQGDPPDRMYFVESGTLTAQLERPGAPPVRLETVGAGSVLGELGFFLDEPRSASVVADAESVVHHLDRDAFDRMKRDDPQAALALHRLVVQLVSARVGHLMGVVQALER